MRKLRQLRPTVLTPLEGRVVLSQLHVMPARLAPIELVRFGGSTAATDLTTVRSSSTSNPRLIVATSAVGSRSTVVGSVGTSAIGSYRAPAKLTVGTQVGTTLHTRPTVFEVNTTKSAEATERPEATLTVTPATISRATEVSTRIG